MNRVYLTGLLLPGDFGATGECSAIHLCTDDERTYLLTEGTANLNLEGLLRKQVRITGILEIIAGQPQIVVQKVSPFPD